MTGAVGHFTVRATATEAATFRATLGPAAGAADGFIPAALPIRWLLAGPVRAALRDHLAALRGDAMAGKALVHLEQHLSRTGTLRVDQDYGMAVRATPDPAHPTAIRVSATIHDATGAVQAEMSALLALVNAPGVGEAA